MGLLDRISAARGGSREVAPRGEESRFSMDQWVASYLLPANEFGYNNVSYPFGVNQTWTTGRVREIATTLPGYLSALQMCPPAFAAQMIRATVLSQARFTFRNNRRSKTPGRLFGTSALGPLEVPWPNGTTGELLARMEWHAGLAGNAYVTNRQIGRLRVLRPDWVVIIYGSQQQPEDAAHALDGEVIGYAYCNGGFAQNQYKPEVLLPDEVAHFAPMPDPQAAGIGMSWITPAIREIQGDRAMTDHKLKFFANSAPQPLDAALLTPQGWINMGSVRVGDHVVGSDGKSKAVVAVYPQGVRDVYRVTFSCGATTECTADHVWSVANAYDRKRAVTRLMTLAQIAADGVRYDSGPYKWSVPLIDPVEFDDPGELSIDPYLLGSLLGDGCLRGNQKGSGAAELACHSNDIDEQVELLAPLVPQGCRLVATKRTHGNSARINFAASLRGARHCGAPDCNRSVCALGLCSMHYQRPSVPRGETTRYNPLTEMLKRLGLWGVLGYQKSVPDAYMRGSVTQRVALLQGLIDTDGSINRVQPNTVVFDSTSEQLARQVAELATGLGAVATVRLGRLAIGNSRAQWHVSISRLPEWIVPCRLARKAALYSPEYRGGRWRYIQNIEYVGRKPTQCIGVDSADHLYATDNCILTHNTPNLVVKGIVARDKEQFNEIVDNLETRHAGVSNAYKTMYLSAGADATVVGADLQQLDFRNTQGAGETRVSLLSRVHPVILGASDGLQGSSLNMGNFSAARRMWADSWIYPTLQEIAASLAPLIRVPADAELWTTTADMPILREDAKDAAEIEETKGRAITNYVVEGFTPESAIAAVDGQDIKLLVHTGLISVQLQPPGALLTDPGTPPAAPPKPAPPKPAPPKPGPPKPKQGG